MTDPSGTQYVYSNFLGGQNQIIDSNGNPGFTGGFTLPDFAGYGGTFTDSSQVSASISGGAWVFNSLDQPTAETPTLITYNDTTGATQTITITYSIYDTWTLGYGTTFEAHPTPLVSSVLYPDGSAYYFGYQTSTCNPSYSSGVLGSMTLPSGGVVQYQSSVSPTCSVGNPQSYGLTRTTSDGATIYHYLVNSTYSNDGYPATSATTVTYPDNSGSEKISFVDPVVSSGPFQQWYQLETAHSWLSPTGNTLRSTMRCYDGAAGTCTTTPISLPISQLSTMTMLDNGQSSKTIEMFNPSGLATEVDEYDFGASAPIRKTVTAYESLGNNIISRPSSVIQQDGSGNLLSQITYGYDEYSLGSSSANGLTSISGSRGNRTSQHVWNNTLNNTLDSHWCYDNAGQIVASLDPSASAQGGSCTGGARTTYSHDATDTYVTGTTYPTPSSGVTLSTSASYNPNTGLIQTATDQNGQSTQYSYNGMLQPLQVNNPDGGYSKYAYFSGQTGLSVAPYLNASVNALSSYQLDAYGRPSRVSTYNGQSTNGYYLQDTCYGANGLVTFESYRYQGGPWSTTPKICSQSGDSYSYDALNRLQSVTHADGTSINYSYKGRATQEIDENGVARITQVDGLGRQLYVCELSTSTLYNGGVPAACNLDLPGTGYLTTFSYNLASRSTGVKQGVQVRTITTDSVGRTVSVSEPERGMTGLHIRLQQHRVADRSHAPEGESDLWLNANHDDHSIRRSGPCCECQLRRQSHAK